MKTLRTTILTLFLFCGVLAFYFYNYGFEKKSGQPSDSVRVGSMQLYILNEGDQINWLHVENKNKKLSITFEKDPKIEDWMIRYPVNDRAESLLVNGLVSALKISTKVRRLKGDKNWGEFGLANPDIKISVETEKNKKRRSLLLGDPAPVGNLIFARWEDEEEYFLLNADFKKAFDQTFYAMRQKKLLRTPLKELTRLSVQTEKARYELSKMDGEWYWVEPLSILGEKVEKRDMDIFYGGLDQLFIKDFLDQDRNPKSLGFSSKKLSLVLTGQPPAEERIQFGKELPARDAFIASRKGENQLFLIAKSNLDQLIGDIHSISQTYHKRPAGKPAAVGAA